MFSGDYRHGSAPVEGSTVAVVTEYRFYQEPKAFDSWVYLTTKLSHSLKGVMQQRALGGGVRIMEISAVGCVSGLKCSGGLCQLHAAAQPLPS